MSFRDQNDYSGVLSRLRELEERVKALEGHTHTYYVEDPRPSSVDGRWPVETEKPSL